MRILYIGCEWEFFNMTLLPPLFPYTPPPPHTHAIQGPHTEWNTLGKSAWSQGIGGGSSMLPRPSAETNPPPLVPPSLLAGSLSPLDSAEKSDITD